MYPNRLPFELSRAKKQQVLGITFQHGEMTRQALRELTGLQQTSLNRVVASLLEQELLIVSEDGVQPNKRGRPLDLLKIHSKAGGVVGLEFGREQLTLVVVNALGEVMFTRQLDVLPPFEGTDATMAALATVVREATRDAGVPFERLRAVGIALHDVVTAEGEWKTLERSDFEPYNVKTALQAALAVPVVVEDVSRAFAEAEHRFGAGRGERDIIYVFIGSHGVGGGVFVNDTMLKSSTGICGEIGHIVIDEEGALCQCGSRGCFETVASHRAVVAQFGDLQRQGVRTRLPDEATFKDICQAAGEGDKGAYLVLHQLAQSMGKALSQSVNLFGAPTIIIGGALRLAGDTFLQDVATTLRQRVVSGLVKHISVRFAELPPHAGAWGVAINALEDALWRGEFLREPRASVVAS